MDSSVIFFQFFIETSIIGDNPLDYIAPPSLELSTNQTQTLLSWVNGTSMTRIYNYNVGNFNKGSFEQIVSG